MQNYPPFLWRKSFIFTTFAAANAARRRWQLGRAWGDNTYYLSFFRLKTFEELGVSEEIRRAITELGFESPMPVQEEVIPYLLGNRNDVIALAQTGTGKTAAFGIPVLQRIDTRCRDTQALVLSPTRELCLQIADDLKDFSKYMGGINIVPVYGGTSIENQIRALRHGAQIIVATPGRLIDLKNRGVAKLGGVDSDLYKIVLEAGRNAELLKDKLYAERVKSVYTELEKVGVKVIQPQGDDIKAWQDNAKALWPSIINDPKYNIDPEVLKIVEEIRSK